MIDKRLLKMIGSDKKYIYLNVLFQWIALAADMVMMFFLADLIQQLYERTATGGSIGLTLGVSVLALAVRYLCAKESSKFSFLSSKAVKKTFRTQIYEKLLALGPAYKEQVQSSEIVQVSVEGVDQLETYFGAYIPQFFYAMIAPLTLAIVLSFVSASAAWILFAVVWLIPVTIMAVQMIAKKLLSKYWDKYAQLGDTFLENLQGMTTLKIYQADEARAKKMDEESEGFRKITMKVLTMQLNSITIMDFITYAGAALGVILAVNRLRSGAVDLAGALVFILLAVEFFLPMRRLGSYFHVAMNGMTASKKMFQLLDLEVPEQGSASIGDDIAISCEDLSFSYDGEKEILHNVSMQFPQGSFTGIVGESGCGKSTVASLIMGRNRGYDGSITVGGTPLSELSNASLLTNLTYIGNNSYLFQGTVRDNLLMANPEADDEALWAVLREADLADFLQSENGLDTVLNEQAANLSGGQRQRLALARALLHDSRVYLFDEATSNIDLESEEFIMKRSGSLQRPRPSS